MKKSAKVKSVTKKVALRTEYGINDPLTVAELIRILKTFDQDSKFYVGIGDGRGNVTEVYDFAIADEEGATFFAIV